VNIEEYPMLFVSNQVRVTASLGTTTAFLGYFPLLSLELCHDCVLKSHLRWWWEKGLFKLCLASTPNRCGTYGVYRNKPLSREQRDLSSPQTTPMFRP